MTDDLAVLQASPLFQGMDAAQIRTMLGCIATKRQSYAKGAYILNRGDTLNAFGLVLSGGVHVVQDDFWGNRNILADIGPGEVFGESYACSADATLGVNAIAREPTAVLMINVRQALSTCTSSCEFHHALIRNLVSMLAAKNLLLNEKLQHITQRSTREKLLSFLSAQSRRKGSEAFEIAFNRQQLADYLSVDRSALSSELCKLRDEGVLRFEHNHFELLMKA